MVELSLSDNPPPQMDEAIFKSVGQQVEGMSLIDADIEEPAYHGHSPKVVEEIESYCMNCEDNGITRLLLTKIPYFREIILMSFYCEHCHFKNTEIQSAGEIQERGGKHMLKLEHIRDMGRQVVKSDTAVLRLENLDLEVPPGRGKLTNVEGLLNEIRADLEEGQERRKQEQPELAEAMESRVIKPLTDMIEGRAFPFSISLNDPAGNSMIEPDTNDTMSKYVRTDFPRTAEQNVELGLSGETEKRDIKDAHGDGLTAQAVPQIQEARSEGLEDVDILDGVMYTIPCECPGCSKSANVNLQMVNIPFFKQVVISAVVCGSCGYRTNDVKTGGEIPENGQRIWLDVESPADLRRDILKSETCMLKIPACKIEVVPGTMGGRFTTVEGLLTQIRDDLKSNIFDFDDKSGAGGDSMPEGQQKIWADFFAGLDSAMRAETKYTILLEDPLANSYVQSLSAPYSDPQIRTEEYERSAEEEEELGLTDMRTQRTATGEYIKEARSNGRSKLLVSEKPEVKNQDDYMEFGDETRDNFVVIKRNDA